MMGATRPKSLVSINFSNYSLHQSLTALLRCKLELIAKFADNPLLCIILLVQNLCQFFKGTVMVSITDYTDCSTLPGKADQAYCVSARHAMVSCNVF